MGRSTSGSGVRVVCAIIEQGSRFLACRRAAGRSRAGRWEFPGGKVEPGELPRAALVRELREELGIGIKILARLRPVAHEYHDIRIELIPYRCRIVSGEAHPVDHDAVAWVGPAQAGRLCWAEADVTVLNRFLARHSRLKARPPCRRPRSTA